jgi:hypothetical protein
MKVLFVCKERFNYSSPYGYGGYGYGTAYGLITSAELVSNFLNSINIESQVSQVVDGNGIDKIVYNYKPTHVFIEAIWATPAKLQELQKKYPKIIWIIRVHSDIPFLAMEGIALNWVFEYINSGLIVAFNKKDALQRLERFFFQLLPNLYYPFEAFQPTYNIVKGNPINIGCFGALRPLKNQLQQAVAAIEFGEENGFTINFHINSTRLEQGGDTILKNLKSLFSVSSPHTLVQHPWMSRARFLSLLQTTIDVGMQVSFTETYDIVAADFINMGIPIIGSTAIPWISIDSISDFVVDDMVNALSQIILTNSNYISNVSNNQKNIESANYLSGLKWIKFLKETSN